MICYLDKTFCSQSHCLNYGCHRNVTPELKKAAEEWWGDESPPISVTDLKDSEFCVVNGGYIE